MSYTHSIISKGQTTTPKNKLGLDKIGKATM